MDVNTENISNSTSADVSMSVNTENILNSTTVNTTVESGNACDINLPENIPQHSFSIGIQTDRIKTRQKSTQYKNIYIANKIVQTTSLEFLKDKQTQTDSNSNENAGKCKETGKFSCSYRNFCENILFPE